MTGFSNMPGGAAVQTLKYLSASHGDHPAPFEPGRMPPPGIYPPVPRTCPRSAHTGTCAYDANSGLNSVTVSEVNVTFRGRSNSL